MWGPIYQALYRKYRSRTFDEVCGQEQVTETLTAEDPENFIFAGKGWGHGVGISQYGTKDLADAGVPAEQILALYFPKATLCDYRTMQPTDSTTQTDDAGNMPTADGESEE